MPAMWNEAERVRVEKAWPDYSEREDLLLLPSFFGDSVDEWGLTERYKWEEVLAGKLEHVHGKRMLEQGNPADYAEFHVDLHGATYGNRGRRQ